MNISIDEPNDDWAAKALNWKWLVSKKIQVFILTKQINVLLCWLKPFSTHDEVACKIVTFVKDDQNS